MLTRNIENEDLFEVECLAKKAFWNLNMLGCDEHYLVHRLWNSEVCVPIFLSYPYCNIPNFPLHQIDCFHIIPVPLCNSPFTLAQQ